MESLIQTLISVQKIVGVMLLIWSSTKHNFKKSQLKIKKYIFLDINVVWNVYDLN